MSKANKKGKSEKSAPVEIATVKEIRLNSDLVGFLAVVIEEKLAAPGNAEVLREMYEEKVGLRFTNIERVIRRSNRPGLVEVKKKMLDEKGIKNAQVFELEQMLKDLAKEKQERNYISVQV